MKRLTVEQQFEYLSAIWDHGMPGYVFLPWIPGHLSREERRRGWNESQAFDWEKPEDRAAALEHIRAHTKDELYFTPAKFLQPDRREQHVDEGWILFADLDEADPEMIDKQIRPTMAWESSPGRFQAVWFMNGDNVHAYDPGGLNQRLTYYIGADPSGWDAPQVLRIPGRMNYKPEYRDENDGAPVPGTLSWFEPDRLYDWDFMDQFVPSADFLGIASSAQLSEIEDDELEKVDRAKVWARVRLKVSPPVRRYMSMKSFQVTDDIDRSEVVWQISCDLADAGCSVPEIVAILRGTPWNKFEGRGDELKRLWMGAVRAKQHSTENAGEDTLEGDVETLEAPPTPLWVNMVAREQGGERPSWLVHNIWAKRSVGFIAGAPKSYKSYLALDLAISVASGRPFLNDPEYPSTPGRVLYLQEEDSLPIVLHRVEQVLDVKAPELSWKGRVEVTPPGDDDRRSVTLSDVFYTPPVDDESFPLALHVRKGFVASSDVWQSWLDEFLRENHFDLVVIDTLGTTVGDIDTDKSGPLNNRVLRPLKVIAEQQNCAIVIVHHNRKPNDSGKSRSGQQMLGSVALHAWVESALYVQSKETLKPGTYEIKVERENKLAEDFKFRVRIPQMWVERRGHPGERQLWEPEVIIGWGEDAEAEQKAEKAAEPKRGTGGLKLSQFLAGEGHLGKFMMPSEIAKVRGRTVGQVMSQILAGVQDGNFEDGQDGTYAPV